MKLKIRFAFGVGGSGSPDSMAFESKVLISRGSNLRQPGSSRFRRTRFVKSFGLKISQETLNKKSRIFKKQTVPIKWVNIVQEA